MGKFFESGNRLAKACHVSCGSCKDALESSCTTCNDEAHRSLDTGKCICDDTHFDSGKLEICNDKCHFTCQTCTKPGSNNPEQCTTCNSGLEKKFG